MKYELVSVPLGAAPFLLKRRQIPGAIAVRLREAAASLPDELRFETDLAQLDKNVSLALAAMIPMSAGDWLGEDVKACARWLAQVAQATRLSIRLEKLDDRMCPKFHVDAVPLRLLCTYIGLGTEWTDPNTAYSMNFGEAYDETLVHHIPTGAIVIYGGSRCSIGLQPLWHRSPAVPQGESRLLLCVDPLLDP